MKTTMMNDQAPTTPTSIACDPTAIPVAMRDQWVATGKFVYGAVQEVQELADGFAFRLPAESAMLMNIAEYIANERLCCPFLHFTVEIPPHGAPFWLLLTGGEGVKSYMQTVFAENTLLSEDVAKAAGLRA